jgi:transcriptional regulator with XRE-family HTH domain
MARKPKNPNHPVRKLRTMIGKTQAQFAELAGIKADTLKKIENYQRGLTAKIARAIHHATGIDARMLREREKLMRTWKLPNESASGRATFAFTSADYTLWREGLWPQDDAIAKDKALKLAPWIEILFRGAARKNRMWQAFARMVDAMNECREDLNLTASTGKVLEENQADYRFRLPDGCFTHRVVWNPSPYSILESAWLGRYRKIWESEQTVQNPPMQKQAIGAPKSRAVSRRRR